MCSGTGWGRREGGRRVRALSPADVFIEEKKHLWIWAGGQDREGKWWSQQAPLSSGGPPSSSRKGWVSSTSFPTGSPGAGQPGSGPAVPSPAGLPPVLSVPPTPRQPCLENSCWLPPPRPSASGTPRFVSCLLRSCTQSVCQAAAGPWGALLAFCGVDPCLLM